MGLFRYVSSKTKKYVFHKYNQVQVPTLKQGGEMTDFYIAKLENTPPVVIPQPPVVVPPSATPQAGERMVKTIAGVEFAFRYCPAGTFTMGSPKSEEDREDNETQHRVTISKGFWMMETEVTQAQWKAVMGSNPSNFKGDNLPVEDVSWTECYEFCEKISQLSGQKIQLPTEAHWEYACRAGTTGAYAGDLDAMAWYADTSGDKTHPVGTKKPNAWGLYDMHGNVYEWCTDRYGEYQSGTVTDPTGPSSGSRRVSRGGCWVSGAGAAGRRTGAAAVRSAGTTTSVSALA